jgi:hypothetical protein
MTTPTTHSKAAFAFASLPDRAVPRRCAGTARLRSCRHLRAMFGRKTRPLSHPDDEPYGPTVVESALAAMRNPLTGPWLRLLTPSCPYCLVVNRSKALLDSAGHPGFAIGQSTSGAAAEKASPWESVSSLLSGGGILVWQIRFFPVAAESIGTAIISFELDEWTGLRDAGRDLACKSANQSSETIGYRYLEAFRTSAGQSVAF